MARPNPFRQPTGDFAEFSDEDLEEAKFAVQTEGVQGLTRYVTENLDKWRNVPLRIAIVGESGVGKSTFINNIRGLTADDEGAAAVGTGDTTREPTAFPHPYNEQIIFWDLPGVGTPKFPKASYSAGVGLQTYDFFLLLSDDRFTANDVWLAREIENQKKNLFFVRTKIDDAMENAQRTEGQRFRAEDVIKRIKDDCEKNFKVAELRNRKVYVISNYESEKWEYGLLMEDILCSLPAEKRLAMVLSLGPISKDIIGEKTTLLKGRVWKVAALSAAASAAGSVVPVAGMAASLAVDVALLVTEVSFYLRQYGIDEESLRHLSERTNTHMEVYVKCLKSSSGVVFSKKSAEALVWKMLKGEAAETAVKGGFKMAAPFLPLIGAAISGVASFVTCRICLNNIIDSFQRDAEEIADKVIEVTSTAV